MAAGALGIRTDPLMGFNFLISLVDAGSALALPSAAAAIFDAVAGGFSECTGLDLSLDVEEFKEGGRNSEILTFPTRSKWGHITLKKGIGTGTVLWDWAYGFVEGRGRRRDGVIVLMDHLHIPSKIWRFRRGLPFKYTGPAMNATQNAIAIESIEIAHEGLEAEL